MKAGIVIDPDAVVSLTWLWPRPTLGTERVAIQLPRDHTELQQRIAAWRKSVRDAGEVEPDWEVNEIDPLRLREPPECG